jgi:hypothetical protein
MALFDDYAPGGLPVRQRAAPPRLNLKSPLGILGLLGGAAAFAHDPAQTLGALFTGLNGYQTARQGVLNQQYGDEMAAYTAAQKQAIAEQKAALDQAKLDETRGYHTGMLDTRRYGIDTTAKTAGQRNQTQADTAVLGTVGRMLPYLGPTPSALNSLNTAIGRVQENTPAGGSGVLFNEGGDGAAPAIAPGGTAYLNQQRGIGLGYENQIKSDPAYVASMVKAPGIQNNARYEGMLNTRGLRNTRAALLPYQQKQYQANTNYLNNVRTPAGVLDMQRTQTLLPLQMEGLRLGNEGKQLDNTLKPFKADVLPPGTNPDGTYTIPSGPLKGSVVTPGAVKAKGAKLPTQANALAQFGYKAGANPNLDATQVAGIVSHYIKTGAIQTDQFGYLAFNDKAADAAEAKAALRKARPGGTPKAARPKGAGENGGTVFELP